VRLLSDLLVADADFIQAGGDILVAILGTTFVMWVLIVERLWYARTVHRRNVAEADAAWRGRRERTSWHAHQIRRALVSQVSLALHRTLPLIKTLVALCPLLGLLGTVTGMIEVFDVMAIAGSGNPRAMASGVSRATIPTMAGMVAALSGLIFSTQLERWAQRETEAVADHLAPED
jgi:biopolymer transport protein ExbB